MLLPRSRSDETNDQISRRQTGRYMKNYKNAEDRLSESLSGLNKAADAEEAKHIRAVTETEDSFIVEFGKSEPDEEVVEAAGNEESDEDSKSEESVDCTLELKALDMDDEEAGTFEGYGSVFNNTDLGNDVILNGAFKKSLAKTGPKAVKLLYQHKTDMPIGVFESIEEDERGLKVRGKLALKTQLGAEAYELMKMGALDGLSIGFRVAPKGQSYDARRKRRMIKEVDLMEISLVTFPMNPKAKVRSVKGAEMTIREWENGLRDVFHLSRSEAKRAAKAVHETFSQRDAGVDDSVASAILSLTKSLKN